MSSANNNTILQSSEQHTGFLRELPVTSFICGDTHLLNLVVYLQPSSKSFSSNHNLHM